MDPLSVSASVIAVLQLVNSVASFTYDFLKAGREAQAASTHLRTELFRLETILMQLKGILHEDKSKDFSYTLLRDIVSWLDECRVLLEDFSSCLKRSNTRLGQISDRFIWPLKEKQLRKLINLTNQTKNWVLLGLTVHQRHGATFLYD